MERIMPLLNKKDFRGLKGELQQVPLAQLHETWSDLKPFQKVILFKLLERGRALEMYSALPFEEKYLVLCAKQLQTLAPILEAFPQGERSLFHEIDEEQHDQMVKMAMREAPTKHA